jgi:hypothetical protein
MILAIDINIKKIDNLYILGKKYIFFKLKKIPITNNIKKLIKK